MRRLSLRWLRAAGPHNQWATIARKSTEFLEGYQWPDEVKAALQADRRSALTINKIAPLFRLVMGYQSSNRLDINFLPSSDANSNEGVAEVLNFIQKVEENRTDLKYTDTEVFADGITTGRGWWDLRLCFQQNDFGEVDPVADDPFSIYVDPDCYTYDINKTAAYVQKSVWTDIDSINEDYGSEAAEAVENLFGPTFSSSLLYYLGETEKSPERFFGQYMDDKDMHDWADVYHTDFVDYQAKRIRLLDSQYCMTRICPVFVDLETGAKAPVPDEWLEEKNQWMIQKSLDYAQMRNNPLKIVNRPVKKIRWTVSCADIILHDEWSPYDTYTKIPFFPYFRRGKTRGMVEDLIDPQMEINKKRSILVDILNRNSNSGWQYEDGSLDPDQEENLRVNGAQPGFNLKWKRKTPQTEAPRRIEAGGYPQGLDRLEQKAADDLHQISGINESALGQLDRVQSGRAIEARQRQAVLSIEMYQDNFSRSKKQQGEKFLELYQKHYVEERIYRMLGEDSRLVSYEINKKQMMGDNSVTRINDITVGRYMVSIDQVPISATFKQAQFEETMLLLEKLGPIGQALATTSPELLIDQSSLPNKEEWKKGLQQATQEAQMQQQMGAAGALPAPQGTPVGPAAGTPEGMVS